MKHKHTPPGTGAATAAPTAHAAPLDTCRCPLCGGPNDCAMADPRSAASSAPRPCWCTQAQFSPDLLARLPAAAQGRACICARCAAAAPAC